MLAILLILLLVISSSTIIVFFMCARGPRGSAWVRAGARGLRGAEPGGTIEEEEVEKFGQRKNRRQRENWEN